MEKECGKRRARVGYEGIIDELVAGPPNGHGHSFHCICLSKSGHQSFDLVIEQQSTHVDNLTRTRITHADYFPDAEKC